MTAVANGLTAILEGPSSSGRAPEIRQAHDLYGFVAGGWGHEVKRDWAQEVSRQKLTGEVHAGWVLEAEFFVKRTKSTIGERR